MLYQISDFLRRVRVPVAIEDDKLYRLVTIRMNHKGVVPREEKMGSAIGTKTMYRVTAGQFILSGIDARNGAFGIVPDELHGAVVTNDFWYFEIDNTIISRDYFLYLTSTPLFADIVRKASDGTTNRVRLQADKFYTYRVNLPDVIYQDEIIDKVIKHESGIRVIEAELQTQQTLLTKLRQSILQEAVQGKLTERWRAERKGFEPTGASQVAGLNPAGGSINDNETAIHQPVTPGVTGSGPVRTATGPDETGAELLTRIRAEKAELIRQGKLRKEKPLPPITDAEKPFELPDGWVWCRLGDCVISAKDGPHFSPKYSREGIPFISTRNINSEGIDFTSAKFISKEYHAEISKKCKPEKGDILYTKGGTTGVACVNTYDIDFNVWVHVAVLKVPKCIDSFYLKQCLNSNQCYDQSQKLTHGIGNQDLGLTRMVTITLPLPPISEQQAIVAQVEKALAQVSELEVENRQQQAEVGRLMQAVLREAFAGKEVVIN